SVGFKNPFFLASNADIETLACATHMNAGIRYAAQSATLTLPGIESAYRCHRCIMPHPPGTRPAPISTSHILRSIWATILCEARQNSAPPPKVMPNGADMTGIGAYL